MKTVLLSILSLTLPFGVIHAEPPPAQTETIVLAAGCFWCTEAIFEQQPGVLDVVSGYAGGTMDNPTYENHGAGADAHAESIQITFDPAKTSFDKLLAIYWKSFDPTDSRGVAPDFGASYRSIIFYSTPGQKQVAEASKAAETQRLEKTVATEVAPLTKFWPAEAYHQDFARQNPNNPYVRNVTCERLDRVGAKRP